MSEGKLIILSGPSGAGKSTVIRQILERHAGFRFLGLRHYPAAQSAESGMVCNYHFITPAQFEGMIAGQSSAGV